MKEAWSIGMDDAEAQDSDWHHAVEQAFELGGALAQAQAGFKPRESQTTMAMAVAQAITDRQVLVAEAETGTGKTFAYLVPLLLSGGRGLVSTATKSLQDQLFLRDLPTLRDALKLPVRLALLKGRASYLCLHRLKTARSSALLADRSAVHTLARIEGWSHETQSGDFSEIKGLDERSPVLGLVSSTRENCLGSECPDFKSCHVVKARREALAADVVVVNHHLFFADLAIRESGMAELLPTVDTVIFDEAHQLVSAGVQFLGVSLGSAILVEFARDLLGAGLQHARGLASWQLLAAAIEQSARQLKLACIPQQGWQSGRLKWEEVGHSALFVEAMNDVQSAIEGAQSAIKLVEGTSADFVKLQERSQSLLDQAIQFLNEKMPGHVRWVDLTTHHVKLTESPLDIRSTMQTQITAQPKSWIFTSATLGDESSLRWFTEPAGVENEKCLRFNSPFDFENNARIYVPRQFPLPNQKNHSIEVAHLGWRCAQRLGGRTFILTTTLRAAQNIADQLMEMQQRQPVWRTEGTLQILVQGQSPKRQLLQQFLARPQSILVASYGFWEGIDVPGDMLQCVILDKLPFPPPGDAIVDARSEQLRAQKRNPFQDYFLAETAVSLKQGAGRLIRTETDQGLIVITDPRLLSQSYGRKLLAALPPAPLLTDEGDALEFLDVLQAAH